MGENVYRVYRRGGSKDRQMDWAVKTTAHGLAIRSGPTDATARLVEVPAGLCSDSDPTKEAQKRTDEKLQAGYSPIGFGTYKRGRLALQASPASGSRDDELCWEAREPLPGVEFRKLIDEVSKQLTDHGAAPAKLFVWKEPDVGPHAVGIDVETPDGVWSFGQQPGGGFNGSGRGGGAVRPAQGVAPILVLLRVAREFPGTLAFCDQNADAVTPELVPADPWLGKAAAPFEATLSLAAAIGLCPGALPLVPADDDDEPLTWF